MVLVNLLPKQSLKGMSSHFLSLNTEAFPCGGSLYLWKNTPFVWHLSRKCLVVFCSDFSGICRIYSMDWGSLFSVLSLENMEMFWNENTGLNGFSCASKSSWKNHWVKMQRKRCCWHQTGQTGHTAVSLAFSWSHFHWFFWYSFFKSHFPPFLIFKVNWSIHGFSLSCKFWA